MSDLKNKLIKLAYDNPEIRADLLPLLKEGSDRVAIDMKKAGRNGKAVLEKKRSVVYFHQSVSPSGIFANELGNVASRWRGRIQSYFKAVSKEMGEDVSFEFKRDSPMLDVSTEGSGSIVFSNEIKLQTPRPNTQRYEKFMASLEAAMLSLESREGVSVEIWNH